jgi:ComF family protein
LKNNAEQCVSCQSTNLHLHGLRYVNFYRGPLRNAIHALKYQGQQRLAEPLGYLLAGAFLAYGLRADALIPLPLHRKRQQQRGYNQSALLARNCASYLKMPCLETCIIRQRATRAQVGLTALERQQNVSGAFSLIPSAAEQLRAYSTIVLVDDICTTGATLAACAAPLYAAGIREVWGLVLGRPDTLR